MKLDYRIAFINDRPRLETLCENLEPVPTFAFDIETINWWHPPSEQVALVQIAYRTGDELRVAVVDALAPLDLTLLRRPLELQTATKAIHNAVFDAVRLDRHFQISTAPIYDTLLAARRDGEKRWSLKAQVEKHLGIPLMKSAQQSDWSVRPLRPAQLDYAALDAVATLLLYEHQMKRGLNGYYRLRHRVADEQGALPLDISFDHAGGGGGKTTGCTQAEERSPVDEQSPVDERIPASLELSSESLALLGIVTEFGSRYSPERLAVCVGDDRVGLVGWLVDRVLGTDANMDEASARIEIAGLCQRGLIESVRIIV